MPTKIKILWVICNTIIFIGFIVLAYITRMDQARIESDVRQKAALKREQEKAVLEKLKKKKPENEEILPLNAIKEAIALGKHKEAADMARQLAELNPNHSGVFTWWGISLVKSGLKSAAIEKFVRAAQLDPTNTKAFLYWGLTLAMEGRFEDAIKKYEMVIDLEPENANAYTYWGESLDQLRRYGEAVQKLEKGLEINKINPAAYEVLIQTLYDSKNYQKAWQVVARARRNEVSLSREVLKKLSHALPEPRETP
ncbi:MAG: tetratricopeptide repeat protein [Nitrospinaceae bacterium]